MTKTKYVKITCPTYYTHPDAEKQRHRMLPVLKYERRQYEDKGVIEDFRDENSLRAAIAVLRKHANGFGFQQKPQHFIDNLDLSVMEREDGKGFRLLTYTRNWQGRCSYYAGVLAGVRRMRRARRKKRRLAA